MERLMDDRDLEYAEEAAYERGWDAAIEATAEWHRFEAKELKRLASSGLASKEARNNAKQASLEHIYNAAAIRKLKKP